MKKHHHHHHHPDAHGGEHHGGGGPHDDHGHPDDHGHHGDHGHPGDYGHPGDHGHPGDYDLAVDDQESSGDGDDQGMSEGRRKRDTRELSELRWQPEEQEASGAPELPSEQGFPVVPEVTRGEASKQPFRIPKPGGSEARTLTGLQGEPQRGATGRGQPEERAMPSKRDQWFEEQPDAAEGFVQSNPPSSPASGSGSKVLPSESMSSDSDDDPELPLAGRPEFALGPDSPVHPLKTESVGKGPDRELDTQPLSPTVNRPNPSDFPEPVSNLKQPLPVEIHPSPYIAQLQPKTASRIGSPQQHLPETGSANLLQPQTLPEPLVPSRPAPPPPAKQELSRSGPPNSQSSSTHNCSLAPAPSTSGTEPEKSPVLETAHFQPNPEQHSKLEPSEPEPKLSRANRFQKAANRQLAARNDNDRSHRSSVIQAEPDLLMLNRIPIESEFQYTNY